VLVIHDTGDRKKGHHTDYVKRQYIGNLGKIDGIVAAAYKVIESITVCFRGLQTQRTTQTSGYLPQQARNCSRNDPRTQSNGLSIQVSASG